MGDYFIPVTVPANTPENAPVETEVEVTGDILTEIAYFFPVGPSCMVRFAVFYGIEQIYPAKGSPWVAGDFLYRSTPVNWRMPEKRLTLTIKAVSPNTQFQHTFYVWLHTEWIEEARPLEPIIEFINNFKKWLGLEGERSGL